jgi:hypothetical protein
MGVTAGDTEELVADRYYTTSTAFLEALAEAASGTSSPTLAAITPG